MENRKPITIRVPIDMLQGCQAYADKFGISRTAAIVLLVNRGLQQEQVIDVANKLAGYYDKYDKDGTIPTDAQLAELENSIKK